MIKRLLILVAVLSAMAANAQDQTTSPYSYFGIGLPTFHGSAVNRAMGGLSINADSIHFNFQNPAALGALRLTTFSVGATQTFTNIKSSASQERVRNTSFDYIALAIPAGKLSFAFGVMPRNSVGYKIQQKDSSSLARFEGRGGLTKIFLSLGYQIKKGLRVGIEGGYNFGNVQNENILYTDQIQYGTLEKNRSNLRGFSFRVGAQYETKISRKLTLETSASYAPSARLTSENHRHLSTIARVSTGGYTEVNSHTINLANTDFDLPSDLRLGVGIGEFQKWFVGAEYEAIGKAEYTNTSFLTNNVSFDKGTVYRLGGFYIPNYDDLTSYFKRITYRAGIRYRDMGLTVNHKDLHEFAVSFGLGLPAGGFLSNMNIGVEYGQRGTTSAGLVQENFVNVFIGISLNDKWFIKRKYH